MGLALAITILAGIVGFAALVWLVVIAFQRKLTGWGIAMIVGFFIPFGPIAALVFLFVHPEGTRTPRWMLIGSLIMGVLGGVLLANAAQHVLEKGLESGQLRIEPVAGETEAPESTPESAPAQTPRDPVAPPSPPRPAPIPARTSPPSAPETPPQPPPAPPTPPAASAESPVTVALLTLSPSEPNQLRTLDIRIVNTSTLAVAEVKLALSYMDARGRRLGGRTSVHSGESPLASPTSTNQFRMTAFRVPEFTTDVKLHVEGVVFTDRSRWPAGL